MTEIDVVTLDKNVLTTPFTINPIRWHNAPKKSLDTFDSLMPKSQEFMVFDGNEKNKDGFDMLPDDAGGIYIFLIKPKVFFDYPYLVYIGKANGNNTLKKRCSSYLYKSSAEKREWVKWLQDFYKRHWHIMFLPMQDYTDDEILNFEGDLIQALAPPYNDKSKKIIKAPIMAFLSWEDLL
jgi:excinuclease UvrABC nuclease subunit